MKPWQQNVSFLDLCQLVLPWILCGELDCRRLLLTQKLARFPEPPLLHSSTLGWSPVLPSLPNKCLILQ